MLRVAPQLQYAAYLPDSVAGAGRAGPDRGGGGGGGARLHSDLHLPHPQWLRPHLVAVPLRRCVLGHHHQYGRGGEVRHSNYSWILYIRWGPLSSIEYCRSVILYLFCDNGVDHLLLVWFLLGL